jgi:hypothetical protein
LLSLKTDSKLFQGGRDIPAPLFFKLKIMAKIKVRLLKGSHAGKISEIHDFQLAGFLASGACEEIKQEKTKLQTKEEKFKPETKANTSVKKKVN